MSATRVSPIGRAPDQHGEDQVGRLQDFVPGLAPDDLAVHQRAHMLVGHGAIGGNHDQAEHIAGLECFLMNGRWPSAPSATAIIMPTVTATDSPLTAVPNGATSRLPAIAAQRLRETPSRPA